MGRWFLFLMGMSAVCVAQTPSAIRFRNGTLDTAVPAVQRLAGADAAGAYVDEEGLANQQPAGLDGRISVLAQFRRPITQEDRQALAEVGAEVVNYVPDQALLLLVYPEGISALSQK